MTILPDGINEQSTDLNNNENNLEKNGLFMSSRNESVIHEKPVEFSSGNKRKYKLEQTENLNKFVYQNLSKDSVKMPSKFDNREKEDIETEEWYKYQLLFIKYWNSFSDKFGKVFRVFLKYGVLFSLGVIFAYGDLLGIGKLEIGFTEFLVKLGELLQQLQV